MATIATNKIRIRLKAYDHDAIDRAAREIVDTAQRTGATVAGPVPLPTDKNVYCVIRSPFKDKDSREHFEIRTHKRLIDIHQPTPKTIDSPPAPGRAPGRSRHRDQDLEAGVAAIIGKKVGMTQLFQEDGTVIPVTVIQAGPCPVTGIRSDERDGYTAVQLAFDATEERKLTKAELGHLKKADAGAMRTLVEFRDEDLGSEEELKIGDSATVEQFEPGQRVKVSGVAIGKGFQGTVKRHGFGRGPVSHGSHNVRAPGSVGASADPARVFKGQRMPGRMGGKRATQKGLEVVEIDAEQNLLMVRGAVPGPKNGTLEVRTDG